MKKQTIILSLIAATLALSSCGSSKYSADIDPKAVAAAVIEDTSIEFPSMNEIDTGKLSNYLAIDLDEIESCSFYIAGSGGYADEVAIIKLKDKSYSSEAVEIINERLEKRKKDFEGYNSDEYDKLENALVSEKGSYVIFSVSEDNERVDEIVEGYFE